MVTRVKAMIWNYQTYELSCHYYLIASPLTYMSLVIPIGKKAMVDEYNALISNRTWALVPRPANINVVRSMWLFMHKYNADGSKRSLVVKSAMIRTVLSLAVSRYWPIHQHDVKNTFLHGHLLETRSTSGLFLSQFKFAEEILE
nr:hypothetical protein [Tanacetum cinerariifolium]